MQFPMLNISTRDWNNENDLTIFVLFDEFIYSDDEALFNRYFKGQEFCDCVGNIFKITKKIPPEATWRKVLRFLPNTYKITLQLQPTHEHYSIPKLKALLLGRLNGIREKNDFIKEWIELTEKRTTYEGVISGDEGQ